jgi:hypothetical protein
METHLNVPESSRAILYRHTRKTTSVGFHWIVSLRHTDLEIVGIQDDTNRAVCDP